MLPEDVAAACRALARTKFFDGDIIRSFANGCVSVNMGLGLKKSPVKTKMGHTISLDRRKKTTLISTRNY